MIGRDQALEYVAATESMIEEMADLVELAQVEEVFDELNMEMPAEMRAWSLTLEFLEATTADALAAEDYGRVLESCRITRAMIGLLWKSHVNHGSRV